MPNFPLASVSIFGRWEERTCSVLYFTQLNNVPSWHSTQGKYIMPLKDWKDSFLRSLSTPAIQHLPSPSIRRVQAPLQSSALLHYTTSYLTTYFRTHLYACKSGFLSPGELAGTLRSDSSCPWTLDTLLPMKSQERNHVHRQSWKFHFYLSRLACFFFFFSYCQHRRWQVKENVKLMLMERQHRNRELCFSLFIIKKTNFYHCLSCHKKTIEAPANAASKWSSLRWISLFYCLLLWNQGCVMLE